MDRAVSAISKWHGENRDRVAWALVAGLLLLRIPFLGGMRAFTWMRTSNWVLPIYEVGTYLLTAVLIWSERDRLAENHVDRLALTILILGKLVELLLSGLRSPWGRYLAGDAYLLYLPVAAGLLVGLGLARTRLDRLGVRKWLWVVVAVVVGAFTGAFCGWVARIGFGWRMSSSLAWDRVLILSAQQLLYAGIAEEPLFRGFLWGALRRKGWRDHRIWLAQAALFWLAHIYWLGRSPVSFWVIVPLGGLVFGLLAWRSRSIAVSMVAHGFVNGVLKVMVS
jgi:membrane protease YdiL (CAAX protease family)